MSEQPTRPPGQGGASPADKAPPPDTVVRKSRLGPASRQRPFFAVRSEIPVWQAVLLGALCIALCGALWWWLTRGEPSERIYSRNILPSPQETWEDLQQGEFERSLALNTYVSLRRVVLGFLLAAVVGVPLGVWCGGFRRINAFFAPLTVFGRNIPVAALIPLTFAIFGLDDYQKVMFIFIACVPFVISSAATSVADVRSQYVDTAYTLGANRWQIMLKVLVPLAMPSVFNSLRVLFGLAFGYIMLAESVQTEEAGGLGGIINRAQSRGSAYQTHIIIVLIVIPLVALAVDRILFWIQRQLFPYQYGGYGLLHRMLRAVLRSWEDVKSLVRRAPADLIAPLPGKRRPESGGHAAG